MKNIDEKAFFSAPEVAKILNVTRATVVNKIKEGKIKAQKVGRNYLIERSEMEHFLSGKQVTEAEKQQIEIAVQKIVDEYGQAIRLLGKE